MNALNGAETKNTTNPLIVTTAFAPMFVLLLYV